MTEDEVQPREVPGIVKTPTLLARYGEGTTVTMRLNGEKIVITTASAQVFYYGEHDRRLWVYVRSKTPGVNSDYCLGADDSVHFDSARGGPPRSSENCD